MYLPAYKDILLRPASVEQVHRWRRRGLLRGVFTGGQDYTIEEVDTMIKHLGAQK